MDNQNNLTPIEPEQVAYPPQPMAPQAPIEQPPVTQTFSAPDAPKKSKKKLIIIIAIIVTLLLIGGGGLFYSITIGIGKSSSSAHVDPEIEKDLKSSFRWGNLPLGVSYLIPSKESSPNNSIELYPHGQRLQLENGDDYWGDYIYIEKVIDNKAVSLEELPSKIVKEKQSLHYKDVSPTDITTLTTTTTKKERIGNIDVVYYEASNPIELNNDVAAEQQIFGYAFVYNGNKVVVQGSHNKIDKPTAEQLTDTTDYKERTRQYLVGIINSFKEYKGESFDKLNGDAYNFKSLFGTPYSGEINGKYYFISGPRASGSYALSAFVDDFEIVSAADEGLFQTTDDKLKVYFSGAPLSELDSAEKIMPTIIKYEKSEQYKKILSSEKVTLLGIDMVKTNILEASTIDWIAWGTVDLDYADPTIYPQKICTSYSFISDSYPAYVMYCSKIYDYRIIGNAELESRPKQTEIGLRQKIFQSATETVMDTMIRSMIVRYQRIQVHNICLMNHFCS